MEELAGDHLNDLSAVLGLAMLNHMLGHVVAVLILDKRKGASVEFFQYRSLGFLIAVFQHALNHTTAVRMGCKGLNLTLECRDDELNVLRGNPLDGLLDHVVAILVLHTLENMTIKLFDQRGLLIGQDVFKSLRKTLGHPFVVPVLLGGGEGGGDYTFWTTRHPYICNDRVKTWPSICFAKMLFCS